jgi:hypothetical protein
METLILIVGQRSSVRDRRSEIVRQGETTQPSQTASYN